MKHAENMGWPQTDNERLLCDALELAVSAIERADIQTPDYATATILVQALTQISALLKGEVDTSTLSGSSNYQGVKSE